MRDMPLNLPSYIAGCRVSVALTRRKAEMQHMLNFEAKPFIAESLRTLFDSAPAKLCAEPPPLKLMFEARCDLQSLACSLLNNPRTSRRGLKRLAWASMLYQWGQRHAERCLEF